MNRRAKQFLLSVYLFGTGHLATGAQDFFRIVRPLTAPRLAGRKAGEEGERYARSFLIKEFSQTGCSKVRFLNLHVPGTAGNWAFYRKGKTSRWLVVGAHYDHLGIRLQGKDTIYFPGANDNASGVAVLWALAKYFSDKTLNHNILFLGFTGEEENLRGSKNFIGRNPRFCQKISAFINLDIVGLSESRSQIIYTYGVNTSQKWESAIDFLDTINYSVHKGSDARQPSDHYAFYKIFIPCLWITTGSYSAYHAPEDTAGLVDTHMLRKVFHFTKDLLHYLDSTNNIDFNYSLFLDDPFFLFKRGIELNISSLSPDSLNIRFHNLKGRTKEAQRLIRRAYRKMGQKTNTLEIDLLQLKKYILNEERKRVIKEFKKF